MEKEIMICVPLEKYEAGITALAKLDFFEAFVKNQKYSISSGEIASLLGFELDGWRE